MLSILIQQCSFSKQEIVKNNAKPCGPSMMEYPETSGNPPKPAAVVSGRFPDNPSLTDHTVVESQSNSALEHMNITEDLILDSKIHYGPSMMSQVKTSWKDSGGGGPFCLLWRHFIWKDPF